jgi:hypothetical protein
MGHHKKLLQFLRWQRRRRSHRRRILRRHVVFHAGDSDHEREHGGGGVRLVLGLGPRSGAAETTKQQTRLLGSPVTR